MADIAQLGIQIDSKTAIKAVGDLDDLTLAAGRAEGATQDLSAASKRMTPALGGVATGASKVSQNSRMMAMQMSQVAQQTSATGNFVQALAIQLPDMAMGFGAVGIAAGILASVTLPLLASMFSKNSEEADKAAAATQRLTDAKKALADASVASQAEIDKLRFGVDESYQVELLREQIRLRGEYNTKVAELQGYLSTTTDSIDRQRISTEVLRGEIETIAGRYNEIAASLSEQQNRSAQLAVIEGVKAQKAGEVAARQAAAAAETERQSRAIATAYQTYSRTRQEADKLADETVRAGLAASDLSLVDFGNIDAGAAAALRMAGNLGIAYGQAVALQGALSRLTSGSDERGSQRSTVAGANTRHPDQPWLDDYTRGGWITPGGGGGGGGGGSDSFMDDLKSLVEEQRSELEVLKAWYEEKQALLADARAKEYLGEQGHKEALIGLETEYMEKLRALQAETQGNRLGQMASFWGAMQSIAESGGKGMAKAAATFGAVEGTINAYRAALQALADPKIGFWGKAAAYASVLAAGLKGVAAIRSAGGIGGGKTAGSVPAQGATIPAAPQTRLIVQGIKLTDILTGEMLMNILGKEFGARNVEFVR